MGCGSSSKAPVRESRYPDEHRTEKTKPTFLSDSSTSVPSPQSNSTRPTNPQVNTVIEGQCKPESRDQHQDLNHIENIPEENDEEDDTESFADLAGIPLKLPPEKHSKKLENYTVDNVVDHNSKVGWNEWFLYAKKVYSLSLIFPILKESMEQYRNEHLDSYMYDNPEEFLQGGYPIYSLRSHGISRKALKKLLPFVQLGVLVDLPRDEYLLRLKQCAKDVKASMLTYSNLSLYENELLEQILRWLVAFPNVTVENIGPSSSSGDPNDAEFKLPEKFKHDPMLLRKWVEGGVKMDCEIHREAAWNVIEPDLVKHHITTEQQEEIIKSREGRTDLLDTKRMRRRRLRIAKQMSRRHNQRVSEQEFFSESELSDASMADYLGWADRLEKHWAEFQKLCEKEFVPPRQ